MNKENNIRRREERRNKKVRNTFQRRENANPSDMDLNQTYYEFRQRKWLASVVEINKAKQRIGYKVAHVLPKVNIDSVDDLYCYTEPVDGVIPVHVLIK